MKYNIGDLIIVCEKEDLNKIVNIGYILFENHEKVKIKWIINQQWSNEFHIEDFEYVNEDFYFYAQYAQNHES